MRPEDLPEIRRLPLFRNMLQANFDELMRGAYAQNFPAGLELIQQGEPADFLHVVVEGSVELFSGWANNRCTMAVVDPIGTFILAACIKDAPYLMSARTLERSRIILVPASDLRAVFRRDPEFAVSVIGELASCYRAMVRHAKNLKLRNSRERLAAYLMKQAQGRFGDESFKLKIEKRLIASYLGMTPENLSRNLKALEPHGVKVEGQIVTIFDRKALETICPVDRLLDGTDEHSTQNGVGLPFGS